MSLHINVHKLQRFYLKSFHSVGKIKRVPIMRSREKFLKLKEGAPGFSMERQLHLVKYETFAKQLEKSLAYLLI